MKTPPIRQSTSQVTGCATISNLLDNSPCGTERLLNLGLYIDPRLMSRLLFLDFIYKKILPVQGVIMDLGTRWGQNAVVFENLRAIYEPYNYQRKIIAFDTFAGFCGASSIDGAMANVDGEYSQPDNYQDTLETLLAAHESLHPLNHIKKFEIVAGNVSETVPAYIDQNPETIVSLAYFDLDIHKPTVDALQAIKDRLTIGSIIVFDELNCPGAPGETLALKEVFGLNNIAIQRFPYCSRVSYIEIK